LCHQSVGLIQSVIERAGIPTVSITLLREITARVAPPRVLFVDRPLGFPLGEANNRQLQTQIITAALEMLSMDVRVATVHEFAEAPRSRSR
jgi:hypothetical protein